jgi:hypothetical protein
MRLLRQARPGLLLVLALAAGLALSQVGHGAFPVQATGFTVTNLDDSGDGSLREAILDANADANEPHTITIGVVGNIALTSAGLPAITRDVTITGLGAGLLTVDASGVAGDRSVFTIDAGATVVIEGLTITGGNNPDGGGIYNSGTLTVENAVISGNVANIDNGDGGGIYNDGGSVTLTNVAMTNEAADEGGSIYNSNGTVRMTDSSITDSTANNDGGAIRSVGVNALIVLNDVTIEGNTADNGGGLDVQNGELEIELSRILGNAAAGDNGTGGGLRQFGAVTTIDTTTISGNMATSFAAGVYASDGGSLVLTSTTVSDNGAGDTPDDRPDFGGGLYLAITATLENVTISGNTANTVGGGVYGGAVTMRNVTFANNTAGLTGGGISSGAASLHNVLLAGNSPNNCEGFGSFSSLGGNMSSDGSCPNLNQTGDDNNVANVMIGPLFDNGGPIETHALLDGSPAIDDGVNTQCPSTDARGEPRPIDGNDDSTATCDVGAYERQIEFELQCSGDELQGGIIPRCLRILKEVPGGSSETFNMAVTITPPGNPVFNDTFDVQAGDDGIGFGMGITQTTYLVVEEIPDGWELTDIDCQGDGISFVTTERTGTLLVTFLGNQQGGFAWGICVFTNEEDEDEEPRPTPTHTATPTATATLTPTATPTATPTIPVPESRPNLGGLFMPLPRVTTVPGQVAPLTPPVVRPPSTGDGGMK